MSQASPSTMVQPTLRTLPLGTTAGLVIFIACCLLSSIRILRDSPLPGHINPDDIEKRSDRRFAALRAALPARGVVGYIGESGDSATPDYYLAQYALAPLVIDRGPNHQLVIGNFPSSSGPVVPQGLDPVKDFGNGVVLFTNVLFSNKDPR